MRDLSAENGRHEEEIPVIRPGAAKRVERTEGEEPGGSVECPEPAGAPEVDAYEAQAEEEPDRDTVIAELQDAHLRVRADFDNFRRRVAKQRLEISDHAKAELARKLLPPLDSLERAMEAAEDHGADGAWVDGLRMVHTQFMAALETEGIVPIEALGQEFDPRLHEVVATMPSDIVPQGSITAEVSRGYRLGDTVIRASQVVTSSGAPEGDEEGEETGRQGWA